MASIIANAVDRRGNPSSSPHVVAPGVTDRREAESLIKCIISAAPQHGFEPDQGYWWMRGENGIVTRYAIVGG